MRSVLVVLILAGCGQVSSKDPPVDENGAKILLSDVWNVGGIVIDDSGMYFGVDDAVLHAPMGVHTPIDVIQGNQPYPTRVIFGGSGVIWINQGTRGTMRGPGGVYSTSKTGGAITTYTEGAGQGPANVVVDPSTGELYWAGGTSASGMQSCTSCLGQIAVDASYVYWIQDMRTHGTVMRIGKSSGAPEEPGPSFANGGTADANFVTGPIAVDDVNVYWGEFDPDVPTGFGEIHSAPKDGSGPARLLANGNDPLQIVLDGSYVYWTEGEGKRVMRVPRDASGPAQVFADGQAGPEALAIYGNDVVWANYESGNIVTKPK
jgi:hypothetical protein